MSDVEKRIGGKITEIRLGRGNTQAELAERVGVSVESISRMERGVSFPSLKTMERLATALNAPLKSFFDFEEGPAEDKRFERELSKLIALLRTLNIEQLHLANRVLKAVFNALRTE